MDDLSRRLNGLGPAKRVGFVFICLMRSEGSLLYTSAMVYWKHFLFGLNGHISLSHRFPTWQNATKILNKTRMGTSALV